MGQLPWRPCSTRASVDFQIDADGCILGCSVLARPRIVGKTVVETPSFESLQVRTQIGEARVVR